MRACITSPCSRGSAARPLHAGRLAGRGPRLKGISLGIRDGT